MNHNNNTLFTIYTEKKDNLPELVGRYFTGATILYGVGLWEGKQEECALIQIIGSPADLQSIIFLAGDIRHLNSQNVVKVTSTNLAHNLDI